MRRVGSKTFNLFVRTVIVYIFLIISLKLMGKRQIGELQISELIITILLSDIAASPLLSFSTPLVYAMIPVITLLSLEIIVSFLITKVDFLKKIFDGVPSFIISRGKLDQKQLSKLRISVNELLSELRLQEIASIDEVEYAILEQNGKLSVIKKAQYQNVTREDMNISVHECGYSHAIIVDGYVNKANMNELGLNEKWLSKRLEENGVSKDDVFLLTADNAGSIILIKKDKKK